MSHLRLITGNRLELLVETLAELLAQPASIPLAADIVMVQSRGMEQWARMTLARINGICANAAFPFPRAFLEEILRKCFPDIVPSPGFDPDVLTYRIMNLLGRRITEPVFESLSLFVGQPPDSMKLYGLSKRIARLFDQYIVFRPEMLLGWERGRAKHWQAVLWRHLVASTPGIHQASLWKRFIDAIREERLHLQSHYQRISIFGISYLPPIYLQLFFEISRQIPVYLFAMNPCREYWSDIVSDYQARHIASGGHRPDIRRDTLHIETGNRLLSAWGSQGKYFFSIVHSLESSVHECFEAPVEEGLLFRIQKDILNLRDPGSRDDNEKKSVSASIPDRSLCIHACHGPMREMEILHDFLMETFDSHRDITPNDILVMAPEIETYAPFIQAVFERDGKDSPVIPFRIVDRGTGSEEETVAGFLALLSLYDTRFYATQVVGLLGHPCIRHRFQLSESDIREIERWVRDTRIRWGIDGADRKSRGVPGLEENTWIAGLEKLLSGYAMVINEESDIFGVMPHDAVEGDSAAILGRFIDFFKHVTNYTVKFKSAHKPEEWIALFSDLVKDFIDADVSGNRGILFIRESLNRLKEAFTDAGYEDVLDFPVISSSLKDFLDQQSAGPGFVSGGVTFCTLLPMRSIPKKIICLVGMNEKAFPREDLVSSFDLMASHPKAGDRSRRRDDKYLFMEALISARQCLHISYVGLNLLDNSKIPPSILVTQLEEYVRDGYEVPDDAWIFFHPLHPFSPLYFEKDSRFYSFSRDDFSAARARFESLPQPLFCKEALPIVPEAADSLTLETLCLFFSNPAAFFMKNRLGIHLREREATMEDQEPFHLNAFDNYLLMQEIVASRLRGEDTDRVYKTWRHQHRIPLANIGKELFYRIDMQAARFAHLVEDLYGGEEQKSFAGEIRVGEVSLYGSVEATAQGRVIRYRPVRARAKDLVDTWIRHLFFTICFPEKETTAHYQCNEAQYRFDPVTEAHGLMTDLVDYYKKGLTCPLPFFPQASYEYVLQRYQFGRSKDDALERAKTVWEGNEFAPGEKSDAYVEVCFRGMDPFRQDFERYAEKVISPMIRHMEKVKTGS